MTEGTEQQIVFRIVGKPVHNGRVLADVFAKKLEALVKAMSAADRAANGQKHFDYVITELKATSASATVMEQRSNRRMPQVSSIATFDECMQAVDHERYEVARRYYDCAVQVAEIAKDADRTFDHVEVTVNGNPTVIVDKIFFRRATEAIRLPDQDGVTKWFVGTTEGSFDGKIVVEDIRDDAIPKVVLRLTAGGKEIECYWQGFSPDQHERFLGKRVRVRGRAHYDGASGLPVRIDILEAPRPVKPDADFVRWGGAFEPFEVDEWGGDH